MNRESYVSEAKVIYAEKISDVDEHTMYAAFPARAVKFARKDERGHGKSIYPWFDNV